MKEENDMAGPEETLLEVKRLKKYFPIKKGAFKRHIGDVKAVDDVNLTVYKGETLGIVGESGSGKSTLGRMIVKLLNPTAGEIIFEGTNIAPFSNRQLDAYRKDMQMIFQDPFASLNPRMTVEQLVEEPMAVQKTLSKNARKEKTVDILDKVGLSEEALHRYPHEFSGGQRQRIGIARALTLNPKFIIADEPVSALDVSVQSQVLNLLKDLQEAFGLTYLFIAHDLSVVKHISDRIAVMYLGQVVEIGPKKQLYKRPLHPYTKALLDSIPIPKVKRERQRTKIAGEIPNAANPPSGCPFRTRCPLAFERCKRERPMMRSEEKGHQVACHLYTE